MLQKGWKEGREWKQEQNTEGGSKEGSEKAAAARVERFAFLSSFLPLLSFHFAPSLACQTGEIPPSQNGPGIAE